VRTRIGLMTHLRQTTLGRMNCFIVSGVRFVCVCVHMPHVFRTFQTLQELSALVSVTPGLVRQLRLLSSVKRKCRDFS
jgi:hypothetical protein